MSWFKSNVLETQHGVEIVTFEDGTDEQIAAMLAAHYAGEIDVTEFWSVGEKRSIHINAMTATGVSEAHHADDYDYVIIGMNHDDLVTPINGINKAAITLQQDRVFFTNTTTVENSSYDAAHEYGYMNSSNDSTTGWNGCARRTWCNGTYFNALPQYIQDNIKQVYKSTASRGGTNYPSWIANRDKCFLLSEQEIFGAQGYSAETTGYNELHNIDGPNGDEIRMHNGGTKYSYFDTSTNWYKLPKYTGYPSSAWWERSPASSDSGGFSRVSVSGSAGGAGAISVSGIAPAFCL